MCELRQAKIDGIADSLPPTEVQGDPEGDVLVLGWGSTQGPIEGGVAKVRAAGHPGWSRATDAPEPAAQGSARHHEAVQARGHARDEPGPVGHGRSRQVPRHRFCRPHKVKASRSARPKSPSC